MTQTHTNHAASTTRHNTHGLLNAIRSSLCVAATVGCLWASSAAIQPTSAATGGDGPVATPANEEASMAKRGRFGPSRKAVIGYWSGTRVC